MLVFSDSLILIVSCSTQWRARKSGRGGGISSLVVLKIKRLFEYLFSNFISKRTGARYFNRVTRRKDLLIRLKINIGSPGCFYVPVVGPRLFINRSPFLLLRFETKTAAASTVHVLPLVPIRRQSMSK